MKTSARSFLMVGVALLTAGSLTFTQSVSPPPPPIPAPSVSPVAAVQPMLVTGEPLLSVLRDNPRRLLGSAAPLGTPASAPALLAIPIAPNIANTIDSIYLTVEPWVEYGFAVAQSIVSWIPVVGWFAGQIGVFYQFFESIVASGVFNFTDFLRGDGGIVENLVDFGVDVGLAFIWLGLDEVAQFIPLPPFCCYPPRPPTQGPFLAAAEAPTEPTEPTMAGLVEDTSRQAPEDTAEQFVQTTTNEETLNEETLNEEIGEEKAAAKEEELDNGKAVEPAKPGVVRAQGEVRGPDIVAAADVQSAEQATDGENAEGPNDVTPVVGDDPADGAPESPEGTD